ncbi:ribosome silencing factor [Iamia sp.]|uniref:ribosome silencing factor n=1 Tax=Iamia sp. TaxID=2722710 RepID=UPI002CE248C5|nr:ribosome silencing factor [Iamia sp.]HXH56129.1 ribosome silencing factor [Iamia sp.]
MADETSPIPFVDPDTDALGVRAARAADDKGGTRAVILRVGDVLGITELFVITSAPNVRLVKAIVDDVEARVAADGGPRPRRVEGLDDARWVLMDYGDWVVHVFLDEARAFYDLERLWADVPRLEWAPSTKARSAAD